jgi:hypothetical protein
MVFILTIFMHRDGPQAATADDFVGRKTLTKSVFYNSTPF